MKKKLVLAIMTITLVAAMVSGASYSWYTDLVSVGPNIFTAAELLVTEGLVLWLDASDADTLTLDGNKVVGWADKSGNGNDAKSLNVDNQPAYESNIINGKSVVRFDGENDFLYTEVDSHAARTIFVVFRKNTSTFIGDYQGVISTRIKEHADKVASSNESINITGLPDKNTIISTGPVQLATGIWIDGNAKNLEDYNNTKIGVDIGFSTEFHIVTHEQSNSVEGNKTWVIGADNFTDNGRYLNGEIAEIIIYSRTLDDDERKAVESYLAKKYGLTLGEAGTGPAGAGMSSGFAGDAPDGEDTGEGEIDGPGPEEPAGKIEDPVAGPEGEPGEVPGDGPGEGSGGDAGAGSGAGAGDGSGGGAQKTPGAAGDEESPG